MEKETDYKTILVFLILGNSTFVLWNTLISSLDFYSNQFNEPKLAFYVMIPSNISLIISNISYGIVSKYIGVDKRIILGLFLTCVELILFPLLAYLFPNNIGLVIYLVLSCVCSFITIITYCSMLALLSTFPTNFLTWYNAGLSISGVLSVIIRIILLLIFDENDQYNKICIFTYYYFGLAFVLLALAMLVFTDFNKTQEKKQNLIDEKCTSDSCGDSANCQVRFNRIIHKCLQIKELVKKHFSEIRIMFPYSILIMILYFQSSFCFPGLILDYKHLTASRSWDITILNFIVCFFDFIGRLSALLKYFSSKIQCTMLILIRSTLCIIFSLLYFNFGGFSESMNKIISIISLMLFSFSSGYYNSILFIKGADYSQEKDKKEFASYLLVLLSNFGSMLGCLAIFVIL